MERTKANYSELLKHPKWQEKRLQIFKRDNFQCSLCGDKNTTLHTHHKKYRKNKKPWEYPDENLMTLCKDCHFLIEEFKYSKEETIIMEGVLFKCKTRSKDSLPLFLCVAKSKEVHIYQNYRDVKPDYLCSVFESGLVKKIISFLIKNTNYG